MEAYMSRVTVFVQEDDGLWYARIPALIGVNATSTDRLEAVARALQVLEEERAFLAQAGLPVPDISTREPTVTERPEPDLLPGDEVPLAEDEIPGLLRRLQLSRERLLELCSRLDVHARGNQTQWGARDVLDHVAGSELFYLSQLERWPDDPRQALDLKRNELRAALEKLSDEDLVRTWPEAGPIWSARRVAWAAQHRQHAWGDYVVALARGDAITEIPIGVNLDEMDPGDELRPITRPELRARLEELDSHAASIHSAVDGLSLDQLDRLQEEGGPTALVALMRAASALDGIRGFLDLQSIRGPSDPLENLAAVRQVALARLSQLNPEERSAVNARGGWDRWTARKVFRRFLEHEREHYDQLRALAQQPAG